MSETHTPEPWEADAQYIVGQVPEGRPHGEVIAQCRVTAGSLDKVVPHKANARRIVAAVNACAGLRIETLEEMDVGGIAVLHVMAIGRAKSMTETSTRYEARADRATELLRNIKEICRHASSRDAQTAGEACMTVVKTVSAYLAEHGDAT